MRDYEEILSRVDAWYRSVKERHPAKAPCERGCRTCCLGLFDVTLADRDLLREGLEKADAATRRDIEARAAAILERLRKTHPRLGEDLDGWGPEEIDALCDEIGEVECPVLGREGECRLYAHRPMTCRMSGVPVVDLKGKVVYPEGCAKCTLTPAETPPLDCDRIMKDERKFLKRGYPGRGGVPILIPQAVARRD